MEMLVGLLVFAVAFAACVWGGRTLSRHYNDRWEVMAALVVAGSVIGPLAVWETALAPVLTVVCAAGLFTGYDRRA